MDLETTLPDEAEPSELGGGTDAVAYGLSAAVLDEQEPAPRDAGGGGGVKRPGRPPIHGLYSKAAGSDGKHPAPPAVPALGTDPLAQTQMVAGPAPRVSIPPDLLSKVICEALTFGESGIAYALAGQGKLAGLTADEIAPQLKRAELGDTRKQVVADLAPYVAQEWGMDIEVSPTAAVGMILVPWLGAAGLAYLTLANLAKEKAAREAAKDKK